MNTSRFTDSQIIAILKQAEASSRGNCAASTASVITTLSTDGARSSGGKEASLIARMKELERKRRRLKSIYVEERLNAEIVAAALTKKW